MEKGAPMILVRCAMPGCDALIDPEKVRLAGGLCSDCHRELSSASKRARA